MADDQISRHIRIAAPPERVWQALLDPGEFGAWFRVALDGPFTVGRTTTGRMTYPGHEGAPWASLTEVIEPPRRLVFRWPHPGESGDRTYWTMVSFTLEPEGGGTLVTVTETGFAAMPGHLRRSRLRDNGTGWDIQTANLKRHVDG